MSSAVCLMNGCRDFSTPTSATLTDAAQHRAAWDRFYDATLAAADPAVMHGLRGSIALNHEQSAECAASEIDVAWQAHYFTARA